MHLISSSILRPWSHIKLCFCNLPTKQFLYCISCFKFPIGYSKFCKISQASYFGCNLYNIQTNITHLAIVFKLVLKRIVKECQMLKKCIKKLLINIVLNTQTDKQTEGKFVLITSLKFCKFNKNLKIMF